MNKRARKIAVDVLGLDPDINGPIEKWSNLQRERFLAAEAAALHAITESDDKITTLKDELRLLKDDPDNIYMDEDGTTWNRPTAWAYFAACKARDKWRSDAVALYNLAESCRIGLRQILKWRVIINKEYIQEIADRIERILSLLDMKPPENRRD